MSSKLATSLFQDYSEATKTVRQLEEAGVPSADISFFGSETGGTAKGRTWGGGSWDGSYRRDDTYGEPGVGTASTSTYDASTADQGESVAWWLEDEGVPSEDAHAYAEGVRRGGVLIAVRCDDSNADRVMKILEPGLDIDEQQASWRAGGWSNRAHDTAYASRTGSSARAATSREDKTIPVAEEKLHVGKRDVGRGRVRIHSHVVRQPVSQKVDLRQEHVDVERRPASRSAAGDKDLFKERTIEMTEKREEPVVSKETQVTEEVVARKGVENRTETVSDEVRRTKVEVEDERGKRTTGTTGVPGRDRT